MRLFGSMSSRVFALLLIGILGSTTLTWWLSFGERQKTLSQFRDTHAIDRAEQLVLAMDALPAENRGAFLRTAPRHGLRITDLSQANIEHLPNSAFASALSERLGTSFRVFSLAQDAQNCSNFPREADSIRAPCEALGITLNDGKNLQLTLVAPHSPMPPLRSEFVGSLCLFIASIAILAYLVARMSMRPLNQLAQAATGLGQDINRPALPEHGSREIRQAAIAFNAMQQRIRQHIQQRTQMLAAITHDLQTPLTRLRLRLEKVSDRELRDKLIDDLSAMQFMVKEGLDLARSMDSNEEFKPLDLDSLLDSVCTDAIDAGQNVSLVGKSSVTVMARPQGLRRCLNNLVDNAIKYGHSAKISLQTSGEPDKKLVHILIQDEGDGISPEEQERVFEPFYRIESSRSRNSGGTGLGLTIAQNIAQQHNGSVQLENRPQGGLEVKLTLPVKPA